MLRLTVGTFISFLLLACTCNLNTYGAFSCFSMTQRKNCKSRLYSLRYMEFGSVIAFKGSYLLPQKLLPLAWSDRLFWAISALSSFYSVSIILCSFGLLACSTIGSTVKLDSQIIGPPVSFPINRRAEFGDSGRPFGFSSFKFLSLELSIPCLKSMNPDFFS